MTNYFNADHLLEWIEKYVTGSITRERQRIANYLRTAGVDWHIVNGILDGSQDTYVFRENGPVVKLSDPLSDRRDIVTDDWLNNLTKP